MGMQSSPTGVPRPVPLAAGIAVLALCVAGLARWSGRWWIGLLVPAGFAVGVGWAIAQSGIANDGLWPVGLMDSGVAATVGAAAVGWVAANWNRVLRLWNMDI